MKCFPIDKISHFKTPFYFYDLDVLNSTLANIADELKHYEHYNVHYAIKANANPDILRRISDNGFGADCVSGGEIKAALKAGFSPDKIVFAGVGKADWEIKYGLKNGIACFNVESVPELEIIDLIARKQHTIAKVALRINPDVNSHTHAHITTGKAENKFGINMEQMDEVIDKLCSMTNIELLGLHFHIGSQILVMDDFIKLCEKINYLQEILFKRGIVLKNINVGGGLGIDYENPDENPIPNFKDYFATYALHLKLNKGQSLHFELGRSIVGQCGTLISKVLYVKQGTVKEFIILDAGMNDLIRPALYGAYHKIQNITSDKPIQQYDIVGPICESSDVFGEAVKLSQTQRGDIIAIRSAGAYGETMASTYNSRPLVKGYLF